MGVFDVVLEPKAFFARDYSKALLTEAGLVMDVPREWRPRLMDIARGESEFGAIDVALIKAGLVLPRGQATQSRMIGESQVEDYFATHGALCVMPTEKCNFRCTYCYETFTKGRMAPDLVAGIKAYLEREMARLPNYSLAWFGGEPLLHPDIIVDVGRTFRELQAKHGTRGSIAITTNGSLLTPALRADLGALPVDLYHVSIDGPREIHDGQRRQPSGTSTYDRILSNVEGVLADGHATVIFRTNVVTSIPGRSRVIARWLVEDILPRLSAFAPRVRYHAVSVWDATTTSVEGICLSDAQRFQELYDVKQEVANALGTSSFELFAESIRPLGSLACYAGKPNHYVVGSDGTVYKCTVALDLPENAVGRLGADGSLQLDLAREATWIGENSLTDDRCGGCALSRSCLGIHCPLTRIQHQAPPCPSEKRFLAQLFENYSVQGVPSVADGSD